MNVKGGVDAGGSGKGQKEGADSPEKLRWQARYCELGVEHLPEAGEVYDGNLVPDQAFHHLVLSHDQRLSNEARAREKVSYIGLMREGMLNKWKPPEEYMEIYRRYDPDYLPVCEVTRRNLTGESGKPGIFKMVGLRNDSGLLIATLTCRRPPSDAVELERYGEDVGHTLAPVCRHFNDMTHAVKWGRIACEIDTINGRKNCPGAATALILMWLMQLRKELGADAPEKLFYFRYDELLLLEPFKGEAIDDAAGANIGSRGFFTERLQCTESAMGSVTFPKEVVVREAPHAVPGSLYAVARPSWQYGRGQTLNVLVNAAAYLETKNIVIDPATNMVTFPPYRSNGGKKV